MVFQARHAVDRLCVRRLEEEIGDRVRPTGGTRLRGTLSGAAAVVETSIHDGSF